MTRVTLTVPTHLNDGTEVSDAAWQQIRADVLTLAGGYTVTPAHGAWLGTDKVYQDASVIFTVDTGSDETVDGLRLLASWIAVELKQEAVYFTTAEVAVEYITPGIPA